jgi:hypothetical protein
MERHEVIPLGPFGALSIECSRERWTGPDVSEGEAGVGGQGGAGGPDGEEEGEEGRPELGEGEGRRGG